VSQRSFIAGARSLNEKDLHDNLAYFKVPQTGIESIRSKLVYLIFDEYANILRGMYSTRFNGLPENKGDHAHMDTAPGGPSSPLITSCIITLYYIHLITHLAGGDHNPNPTLTYSGSDRTYQRDSIVGCIT
jgi:hypothetical protein